MDDLDYLTVGEADAEVLSRMRGLTFLSIAKVSKKSMENVHSILDMRKRFWTTWAA